MLNTIVLAQYVTAGIVLRSQQQYVKINCDPSNLQQKHRQLFHRCRRFLQHCSSPALALIGKLSAVLTVSATASACGTISLAAHQVVSAVFQMFRPMGYSLGQTMQTLIPGVIRNNYNKDDNIDSLEGIVSDDDGKTDAGVTVLSPNAMMVLKVMCQMAVTLGRCDALIETSILGTLPHWFTSDVIVTLRIATTSTLIGCVLLVHALSVMLEGLLFAVGDASMVAHFYLINAVFCQWLFARVRLSPTLVRVGCLLFYQIVRASEFALRLLWNRSSPGKVISKKRHLGGLILEYLKKIRDNMLSTKQKDGDAGDAQTSNVFPDSCCKELMPFLPGYLHCQILPKSDS